MTPDDAPKWTLLLFEIDLARDFAAGQNALECIRTLYCSDVLRASSRLCFN
jgi:hypothetical protein